MPKRNRAQTKEKNLKWSNEGRGKGELSSYKSWLKIQDIASKQKCSRIWSHKTGRIHNLFSPLEVGTFLILEWDDEITDIREHFPIPNSNKSIVKSKQNLITTTFVYTKDNQDYALSINGDNLEIQKSYWDNENIPFEVWKEVNKILVRNLEWIRNYRELEITDIENIENELFERIQILPIRDATQETENSLGLEAGTGLTALRYLLANKIWIVELEKPIKMTNKLSIIKRNQYDNKERNYRVA